MQTTAYISDNTALAYDSWDISSSSCKFGHWLEDNLKWPAKRVVIDLTSAMLKLSNVLRTYSPEIVRVCLYSCLEWSPYLRFSWLLSNLSCRTPLLAVKLLNMSYFLQQSAYHPQTTANMLVIIALLEIITIVILTSGVVDFDHKWVELLVSLPRRQLQPIKGLLDKTLCFLDLPERNPLGCFLYILSSSPCRNVFTSSCSSLRSPWITNVNTNRIDVCLTPEENLIVANILLLRIPFGN